MAPQARQPTTTTTTTTTLPSVKTLFRWSLLGVLVAHFGLARAYLAAQFFFIAALPSEVIFRLHGLFAVLGFGLAASVPRGRVECVLLLVFGLNHAHSALCQWGARRVKRVLPPPPLAAAAATAVDAPLTDWLKVAKKRAKRRPNAINWDSNLFLIE